MFETKRLLVCDAIESDIPAIMQMENHPDNSAFIRQGTYHDHLKEIHSADCSLQIFRNRDDNAVAGFSLSIIDTVSHVFELRRFTVCTKQQGYGKEALAGLITNAFEAYDTNRFWLDVYGDNRFGIRLYDSIGLHMEGVLRQNYKAQRGYLDQRIYSLLREEYPQWKMRFAR